KQTYPDFSPVSFFDTEDFGTDFTSDSAASPLSPLSPALSASSFGFPATDAWTAWDSAELSPEPETLFGYQPFASCPPSNAPSSPAINPLDLAVPAPLSAHAPFFQSPQIMLATIPSQPQPAALPTPSSTPPTNDTATTKRYPSRRALKRRSASAASDDEPATKSPTLSPETTTSRRPFKDTTTPSLGPKKTAHNMIEKRYRTNLNDKITQLRDAVPSLRQMAQQKSKMADGDVDIDDLEDSGLVQSAGAKLNKATILSKATEYIRQLERRNLGLEAENGALRGRMEGLEGLLMGGTNIAGDGRGGVLGVWN
ncbi:sterol regulatory element-binding protein 1, partial [Parachaetomium inaequale]